MAAPLDFLRIWHRVFAQNLDYVIDQLQEAADLRVEGVADDRSCKIGRWLAAQDDAVRVLPEFGQLCAEHARFHRLAAAMLRAFRAGRHDEARACSHGEFREVTLAVEVCIDRLGEALGQHGVNASRFCEAELVRPDSVWSESLTIGIPEVDRRHHAIAMLIDQLSQHPQVDAAQPDAQTFLGTLRDLIQRDAEGEQVYLTQLTEIRHDCSAHIASHDLVLGYLAQITGGGGQGLTLGDIGHHLGDWYIEHLVNFDLDLARLQSAHRHN